MGREHHAVRFVVDGCSRATAAIEPKIRARVTAFYASQLAGASFVRRLLLRRRINREIGCLLARRAPPDALY